MLTLHAIDGRILFKFTSTSLTKCELMFPSHVGDERSILPKRKSLVLPFYSFSSLKQRIYPSRSST